MQGVEMESAPKYEDVLRFFDDQLRRDSPCRLDAEYPLVFDENKMDQLLLSQESDEIRAGLGTLKRKVEIRQGEFAEMLFIGSVVTSPKFRKQGLQRKLFYSIEERAEAAGIDFIVLWSNQMEFYKKLGFVLGGLQATWIPNTKKDIVGDQKKVHVLDSKDASLTSRHYEAFSKKILRVERSYEEIQKLWKIPHMRVAYTDSAYALLGKGEDFREVCHEWAGPAKDVLACIDALRKEASAFRVLSPGVVHTDDERDVVHALERSNFDNRLEFLGLFKAISHRYPEAGLEPHHLKYPFFIWGLDSI